MAKIVLTDAKMSMLRTVWSQLNALGDVTVTDNDNEDTLIKEVVDADLIITRSAAITRRVIGAGKNLKAILKWGVGLDTIDIAAATEGRLPVCHCPFYGAGTVADYAFALMISLARKLVPLVTATRDKGWIWPDSSHNWAGVDLEGKTIGLIGFGRIAQKMAKRCAGFDMEIKIYDPRLAEPPADFKHVELTTLEDLLCKSDFVSVHAVLTPQNRGLIGAKELSLMKSSAFLINTARGALVQQEALLNALRRMQIAGAALDVFESEPLDESNPFYGLDNIITPHVAYYTREATERLDRECYYSARRILNTETLVNVKNGDSLAELGEPVRWLPYGEFPPSN